MQEEPTKSERELLSALDASEVRKTIDSAIDAAQKVLEETIDKSLNIKLVTKDRQGSRYVKPVEVEIEDDGKITLVVEAWEERS